MFNIQYLTRKKIDINKYNRCINEAINTRVYAYSWYLDIVTDDWSVIVLDDYKAVMPIPFLRLKKYFFIKKILQPYFCQQLGVFSLLELTKYELEILYNKFISLNPELYNFNSYYSRYSLSFNNLLTERINYELKLNTPYKDIFSNYSNNLKRNIKKAKKSDLKIIGGIPLENFIFLKKNNSKHIIKKKQYKIIINLISELIERRYGILYGIQSDDVIIASAFIVTHKERIIHLFSATNSLGKKKAAIPFLFDKLVQEQSNKNVIFDFEGSMQYSVARFFKSFGAKKIKYYSYR